MSKETKFTKGCWILHPDGAITDNSPAENEICFIDGSDNKLEDQDYSNAHLIKTAPKLYAEIEDEIKFLTKLMTDNFTVNCSQSWEICERINSLNEALAEARGI